MENDRLNDNLEEIYTATSTNLFSEGILPYYLEDESQTRYTQFHP
jgi:hypothetical protein